MVVLAALGHEEVSRSVNATISRQELHRRVTGGEPIVLVEALGAAYYADAHLCGAVNIPPDRIDELAPRLIPRLDAVVVVYCSRTCHNSAMVAGRLQELGYPNVLVYRGGKEDWVENGLPVERSACND